MDANASSSTFTHTDNSNGNYSSSGSISCDGLITKTKIIKLVVWKYFGSKDEDAMKKETALLNLPQSCCYSWRNMSNLTSHLKIHHPLKHEEFRKLNAESQHLTTSRSKMDGKPQVLIIDLIKMTQKYAQNSRKWQKLTDAVTYYIRRYVACIYH